MNEKIIWNYLISVFKNPYGVAALMGNLMAESSLNPSNVTGSKDPDYINKADSGTIDFVHDGHAFGLAQWCFRTRKEGLLNYAKSKGASVGSINIQLEYICKEIKESYKTVCNTIQTTINIQEASDIIMLKYEKPSNTSEVMKKRRANYGQDFFNMFVSSKPNNPEKVNPKPAVKKVVVTSDRTNIRTGNGTNFSRITQVNKNAMYEWIATSENGWYAIRLSDRVAWISKEFSKLI